MPEDVNIGRLLVAQGLITPTQYNECLDYQNLQPQKPLTDIILDRGLCTREAMMQAIGRYNQYAQTRPDPEEAVEAFEQVTQRIERSTQDMALLAALFGGKKH